MVKKTLNFREEDWAKIEEEFKKTNLTFSDFVREKILNENSSPIIQVDFQEQLNKFQEALLKQNSETIKFFDSKVKDFERKIELITERTTYAFFKTIAEGKEAIQRLTINDFEIGDIIIGHQKIINTILDIDKEKEEFIITPFPLFRLQEDTRKRSLAYLKEKINWLVRIDKTKKILKEEGNKNKFFFFLYM